MQTDERRRADRARRRRAAALAREFVGRGGRRIWRLDDDTIATLADRALLDAKPLSKKATRWISRDRCSDKCSPRWRLRNGRRRNCND